MFPDFNSNSGRLYQRACNFMPGGNTRTSVFWPPHQIYAAAASGSRIIDVDGIERTDFQYNFTTLIHGHGHPTIVARVREQAGQMLSVGLATELEVELAEVICSRVASIEQIRFTNSGTEAVLTAIKAARAHTLRPTIAKCEGVYHGSSDLMETSCASTPENWGEEDAPAAVPMSRGTPSDVLEDIVVLPFNNIQASKHLLERHAERLAAVIIDPMPVRAGLIPATKEYLTMLRDFTRKNGSILIFDEVLVFRLGYNGAQTIFQCEPDLTALGKIIGGGLPIGAVGGKAEIMAVFDPREGYAVWHGGTFNGNAMSMAAGIASMELLTRTEFQRLEQLGEYARRKIREAFKASGMPGQVTGMGSLLRIHCSQRPLTGYRSFFPTSVEARSLDYLMRYLLNHGFLVNKMGVTAISTVTTENEIELYATTILDGLRLMKKEGLPQDTL